MPQIVDYFVECGVDSKELERDALSGTGMYTYRYSVWETCFCIYMYNVPVNCTCKLYDSVANITLVSRLYLCARTQTKVHFLIDLRTSAQVKPGNEAMQMHTTHLCRLGDLVRYIPLLIVHELIFVPWLLQSVAH